DLLSHLGRLQSPNWPAIFPGTGWNRRQSLKRILAAGIAGALAAAYAYFVEPGWIEWTEQEIQLPALPAALDGFRIGHLTDLHVAPSGVNQELSDFLMRCNKLQPDLFVVTGDLVNGLGDESAELAKLLAPLQSRHGTIAILGGHDYGDSPPKIARALAEAGITLLRNEAVAIGTPGAQLWVAGMDDNSGAGRPDLERTLSDVPPGAPFVFLMHSPDSIYQVAA